MDERNEEFLDALTKIDDERVKNIVVSYATEIRKAVAEEILKAWGESNGDFNKWLEMKKTFNVV